MNPRTRSSRFSLKADSQPGSATPPSTSQSTAAEGDHRARSSLAGAAQCRVQTPLGPMTALATEAGLAGLWFDAQAHHPGPLAAPTAPQHPHLQAAQRWLDAYWRSWTPTGGQARGTAAATVTGAAPHADADTAEHTALDSAEDTIVDMPLDLRGTPFQRAVWAALLSIPSGATSTYAAIAAAAGSPAAVRAAGAAIGRNPVSVIVPCHRVLGRDGSLTGYAGGLERKQALLYHELGKLGEFGAAPGHAGARVPHLKAQR